MEAWVLKMAAMAPIGALCGILAMILFNRLAQQQLLSIPYYPFLSSILGATLQVALTPLPFASLGRWADMAQLTAGLLISVAAALVASLIESSLDRARKLDRSNPKTQRSRLLRWHQIFRAEQLHVVLHMKDGRQVFGWPEGWPEHPVDGHFLLTEPRLRVNGKNEKFKPSTVAALLPAGEVIWIQFVDESSDQMRGQKDSDRLAVVNMYY